MKSSIFIVLGLLLMIHYSYSFPQLAEGKSKMPCGKIRLCLKPKFSKKPICKAAPKELPPRCTDPISVPPPPPPCSPKKPSSRCPPPPPTRVDPECKCLSKELDGAGLPIGHCLTKDPANDKFYCYVNANSCGDTKQSKRFHNLHYSYQACWNQRAEGYAAPNCDCEESDVECQSTCIADICGDNPYCWEEVLSEQDVASEQEVSYDECFCEDWDDQCWNDCLSRFENQPESEKFEPAGCYCQDDSDEQCFERCLSDVAPTYEEP